MSHLDNIRARSTLWDILEGQPQHLAMVVFLTLGALALLPETGTATLFGLTAQGWAVTSIALAVIHQTIVAVVFRLQLHRNLFSRLFGPSDMKVWGVIFMPLLVVRPLTIIMIGWAGDTPITDFRGVEVIMGLGLVGIAIWGMHSVIVYFTIPRALGGDHFRDEYAQMPLVDKGAFAVTSNAMYGLIFFGLTGIALLFGSKEALIIAAFQHTYIWVHMYCTEKPDMEWIYGSR